MDVAERIQDEYRDINLRSGKMGEIGLYAAQVCINATTREFHTDFDQGPTLMCVPDQKYHETNNYKFCFHINDENFIQLNIIPNLNFIFSTAMLTHRK